MSGPIVFLCTGNAARSVMGGAALAAHLPDWTVTTAGTLEDPTTYKALGSRALFHVALGVGFDITRDLTLQIYADHFSNAGLSEPNNGAEATGVRLGYRF